MKKHKTVIKKLSNQSKAIIENRDKQIDALKGYAIVLVVSGHIIAFSDTNAQLFLISKFIYSFHMPLFFFVSGYVVFGRIRPNLIVWVGKKFYQLAIPYIIFTIIFSFALFGIVPANFTFTNVLWALWAYTVPNSAWFLPVLLEAILLLVIFIFLERFFSKYLFIFYFISFCIVIPLTPLDKVGPLHQICLYSPYVFMGYLVSRYHENIFTHMKVIEITGIIAFAVLFFLKFLNLIPSVVSDNLLYTYVLATGGIILSWVIIQIIIKIKVSQIFIFLGIFTLEIYLTHLLLLCGFTFRKWPVWFGSGYSAAVSGTIYLLVLSLSASLALSYNRIISLILFGRWPFKSLLKRK
jgi:fucose 4-O-acetylase-like acetyltransferase